LGESTSNMKLQPASLFLALCATLAAGITTRDAGAASLNLAASPAVTTSAPLGNFSSKLPVLVFDYPGAGPQAKDGVDHPGGLHVFSGRAAGAPVFAATAEMTTPVTSTVRGSSSAEFPKKGYNLKLRDESGRSRAQALLDLPAFEKWALVAPWNYDVTYQSNAFVYALSNRIGRWAPRTRFVEIFARAGGGELGAADYAGIYILTDRIEAGPGRVEFNASAPAANTDPASLGYILKLDTKEPGDIAWTTARGFADDGYSSIILVSPKADSETAAPVDYIRGYVQRMEDALHADRDSNWTQRTYLEFIDRASWVDHHMLNTLTCNPDAFIKSAYFTKDREGRLAAGPVWDFDRAMGSIRDGRSWRSDVWSGHGASDVWQFGWWGVLARDPEFMQDWVDRWQSLRRTEFSDASLSALVKSLGNAIDDDAARRDATRWPENAIRGSTYAYEIDFRQRWLAERANWIDTQFVAAPGSSTRGDTITFTAPFGAVLVYTLDGSDPRSLGGEVAPNALFTPAALTVSQSANVHVRSYRADLKRVFPGSPWSSAVGGAASSPLLPKARLINFSSRGRVGTGENALMAGVVMADSVAKRYLARAIGPGLTAFGATGIVPDPQLCIIAGSGREIARNQGWENGGGDALLPLCANVVGAFPLATQSADSAVATALGHGASTLQITTPSGQGGIALAEVYELDCNGRTVNLSTRASVGAGENALIGGFVVSGTASKRILIRGVGPTLAAFGVSTALRDPVLTLYAGGERIASNDRWSSGTSAAVAEKAARAVGAFPLAADSEDAALFITLPPGAYTVEVAGKAGGEGVALLEIYDVP
jgi:hypothetical protein